jgi:chloramphenicol 3-O-phosphotransferase
VIFCGKSTAPKIHGATLALTTAQIDAAIEAILTTGQSVTVDGVTYTRANLADLRSLRSEVAVETANSTQGHLFSRSLVGALRR